MSCNPQFYQDVCGGFLHQMWSQNSCSWSRSRLGAKAEKGVHAELLIVKPLIVIEGNGKLGNYTCIMLASPRALMTQLQTGLVCAEFAEYVHISEK